MLTNDPAVTAKSGRVTAISRCLDAGLAPHVVQTMSHHKNVDALLAYKTPNMTTLVEPSRLAQALRAMPQEPQGGGGGGGGDSPSPPPVSSKRIKVSSEKAAAVDPDEDDFHDVNIFVESFPKALSDFIAHRRRAGLKNTLKK